MCALLSDPLFADYGVPYCGWRGTGGLFVSPGGSLIPLHNYEAFASRKFVETPGYMEILVRARKNKNFWSTLLGQRTLPTEDCQPLRRNLLCSKTDGREVTVYAVNPRSDRKSVSEHHFQQYDVSNCDFILDKKERSTIEFSEVIEEIRSSDIGKESFFVKSEKGLFYYDGKEAVEVFKDGIRSFQESSHISGELAILGQNGMVWSGSIGYNLSRTKNKCEDVLKLISYSDHPRKLFGCSEYEARTIDLRCDNKDTTTLLFTVEEYKKYDTNLPRYMKNITRMKPPILHLQTLPHKANHLLLFTDHNLFLIDERFSCKPLLTEIHKIPYGGDYLLMSQPHEDKFNDGTVYPFYMLDEKLTSVWTTRLYGHACQMFSSLHPIHLMKKPSDISTVPSSLGLKTCNIKDLPIRGITVVEGLKDKLGRPTDLLLRNVDDGTILMERLVFGELTSNEVEEIELSTMTRSVDQQKRADKKMRKGEGVYCARNKEQFCDEVSIDIDISNISAEYQSTIHPLDFHVDQNSPSLDVLPLPHPEACISVTLDKFWNSYCPI